MPNRKSNKSDLKERIVITGSKGNIGTVLKEGLTDFVITTVDLPERDVRDYQRLIEVFPGHEAVVHLAWNSKTENLLNNRIDPDNAAMYRNVYAAALTVGIPRVIMASSIHADTFYLPRGERILSPYDPPHPDSPYGKDKVLMEELGREYAQKGLEVICIRFGGISAATNKPPAVENPESLMQVAERAAWLSHGDAVGLVGKCLNAEKVPGNFAIVYGVSDNLGRVHDTSNPFGWQPVDNAEDVR